MYSNASKILNFKTDYATKLNKEGWQVKSYSDKFFDEISFVYQNEVRKKAGSQPLKWSNIIYELCIYRLKTSGFDYHYNTTTDLKNFARNSNINPSKTFGHSLSDGFGSGENLVSGGICNYKDTVKSWVNSPGHYVNMVDKDHNSGAIATISGSEVNEEEQPGPGMTGIGFYASPQDFDLYWESLKK